MVSSPDSQTRRRFAHEKLQALPLLPATSGSCALKLVVTSASLLETSKCLTSNKDASNYNLQSGTRRAGRSSQDRPVRFRI